VSQGSQGYQGNKANLNKLAVGGAGVVVAGIIAILMINPSILQIGDVVHGSQYQPSSIDDPGSPTTKVTEVEDFAPESRTEEFIRDRFLLEGGSSRVYEFHTSGGSEASLRGAVTVYGKYSILIELLNANGENNCQPLLSSACEHIVLGNEREGLTSQRYNDVSMRLPTDTSLQLRFYNPSPSSQTVDINLDIIYARIVEK
jgi:hypothetical protein